MQQKGIWNELSDHSTPIFLAPTEGSWAQLYSEIGSSQSQGIIKLLLPIFK